MSNKHWVVVAEWCVDYEGGYSVLSVHHSENEAIVAMKKRVNEDDRILAEQYSYVIYEDSDLCFDSGRDGEYATNHISVSIIKVNCDFSISIEIVEKAIKCLSDNGISKDECPVVLQALCYILADEDIEDLLSDENYEP